MSDLDEVKAAIRPNTKMFFIETPTNPMMKVADIHAVSEIAKSVNALTVVDNTFLTPYFQKPLTLGADIVTHSSTKYLGGHNDTISGIVVIKDNEEIADQIHIHVKSHGSQLAPLDSWLVLRGIKTLAVRMDRHNENAMKVAEWLRTCLLYTSCRTTDFTSGYRSRRWTVPMGPIISNREGRGHQCGLH